MVKGLKQRLDDGEIVLIAEGYLLEFERRGYLKAGPFIPDVVLDNPHLLKQLHEEFVHAGSDVVEAFTYHSSRRRLAKLKREHDYEPMNRKALQIAREVADNTGTLMAGNISDSGYVKNDPDNDQLIRDILKEQVLWAVEGGADYIVGETFSDLEEAKMAVEAMKQYGNGLPIVITMAQYGPLGKSLDTEVPLVECMKELEALGATVVGLNCSVGPAGIIPQIREIKQAVKIPVACLPVPYRTTEKEPQWHLLTCPETGKRAYTRNLDSFACNQNDIEAFGKATKEIGVQYIGLCCGNCSRYTRTLAESLGRRPPASRYSAEMALNVFYGQDTHFDTKKQ